MTKHLILLTLVALVGLHMAGESVHAAETPKKPNIVFILTDDQRWNMMACAGDPIIHTPNMDALAKDGVRFPNMFVTTSICAASRASILTGLYERTHRYTFGTKPISHEHIAISYPMLLRMAGYRTGFVGKFGVGVEKGAAKLMFDSFMPLDRTPYWKKQHDGTRSTSPISRATRPSLSRRVQDRAAVLPVGQLQRPARRRQRPQAVLLAEGSRPTLQGRKFPMPKTMTRDFFERAPDFLRKTRKSSPRSTGASMNQRSTRRWSRATTA